MLSNLVSTGVQNLCYCFFRWMYSPISESKSHVQNVASPFGIDACMQVSVTFLLQWFFFVLIATNVDIYICVNICWCREREASLEIFSIFSTSFGFLCVIRHCCLFETKIFFNYFGTTLCNHCLLEIIPIIPLSDY